MTRNFFSDFFNLSIQRSKSLVLLINNIDLINYNLIKSIEKTMRVKNISLKFFQKENFRAYKKGGIISFNNFFLH